MTKLSSKKSKNDSKFAIFLEHKNPYIFSFFPKKKPLVYVDIGQGEKWHEMKKKTIEYSFSKNMPNFETFCCNISCGISLLFLKSEVFLSKFHYNNKYSTIWTSLSYDYWTYWIIIIISLTTLVQNLMIWNWKET